MFLYFLSFALLFVAWQYFQYLKLKKTIDHLPYKYTQFFPVPGYVAGQFHKVLAKYLGEELVHKVIGYGNYENQDMTRELLLARPDEVGLAVANSSGAYFFVSDPEVTKEVLVTQKEKFGKPLELYKIVDVYGPTLLSTEGDVWKRLRKMADPAFGDHNMKVVASSAAAITDELCNYLEKLGLKTQDEIVVQPAKYIVNLALGVLIEAGFGIKAEGLYEGESGSNNFVECVRVVSTCLPTKLLVPNFMLSLPIFNFRNVRDNFDQFEKVVLEQCEKAKQRDTKDILSLLTKAKEEGSTLSPIEILANCFIFYFAGHETTSNTLSYALRTLAWFPDIQEKMVEEVNAVCGDQSPTYADYSKLVYCRGVFKETLRFFPPVPQVPKVATVDAELAGLRIPKDTNVFIDVYSLHFHPKHWDEPEKFKPERFVDPNVHVNPYAYLPFSGGARVCIGSKFALVEGTVALAVFVKRFKIGKAPQDREFKFSMENHITMTPRSPLSITISKRT